MYLILVLTVSKKNLENKKSTFGDRKYNLGISIKLGKTDIKTKNLEVLESTHIKANYYL